MNVFFPRRSLSAICVLAMLGLWPVGARGQAAPRKSQPSVSELIAKFVKNINDGKFDEAGSLLQFAKDEDRREFAPQFEFLKRELGGIELVKLPDEQLREMAQTGQYVLEWGSRPKLTDDKLLMTQRLGVRFTDGSLGMSRGSIVLNRNFQPAQQEKPQLVRFELAAPAKNRKFKKFCESLSQQFATITVTRSLK